MTSNLTIFDSFKVLKDLEIPITVTNISNFTGKSPALVASVLSNNAIKGIVHADIGSGPIDLDNYDSGQIYKFPDDHSSKTQFASVNGHCYNIFHDSPNVEVTFFGVNFMSRDQIYNMIQFFIPGISDLTMSHMVVVQMDDSFNAHTLFFRIPTTDSSRSYFILGLIKKYIDKNFPDYIDLDNVNLSYLEMQKLLFSFWEE